MSTVAVSRLGCHVRRAARLSPVEMAWRLREQVVRATWSPRQVTRHQLACAAAATRELAFTAVLPPDTAARVPEAARKPVPHGDGVCAGGGDVEGRFRELGLGRRQRQRRSDLGWAVGRGLTDGRAPPRLGGCVAICRGRDGHRTARGGPAGWLRRLGMCGVGA